MDKSTQGSGIPSDSNIDDTGQWKRLRCDYRRRQRVTWIRCEVGGLIRLLDPADWNSYDCFSNENRGDY